MRWTPSPVKLSPAPSSRSTASSTSCSTASRRVRPVSVLRPLTRGSYARNNGVRPIRSAGTDWSGPVVPRSPLDAQAVDEAGNADGRDVRERAVVGEAEIRDAVHQDVEAGRDLHPRERRAEAEVRPLAERDVVL